MTHIDGHAPGTPCWFDLMTPDPDKARAFYGALFGWTFEVGGPESGHYAMCQVGGRNAAGMGKMPENAPFPSCWNVYVAVEDADATAAAVTAHGGAVVMPAMDVMGAGRMAFCADPTGAHFGLWQPKAHRGASVRDEPGSMAWQEVSTRDATKARAFYAAVFGLEAKKMEGMDYWTLHRGPHDAGGLMQMGENFPKEVPAHWMPYFAVTDTDAAVATVTKLGGQVRMPAFDTPYGRMAVVADPFGATFSVIKLADAAPKSPR